MTEKHQQIERKRKKWQKNTELTRERKRTISRWNEKEK